MSRRSLVFRLLALAAALVAGAPIAHAAEVIRLGVTAGPHAQIAEIARKVAARDGLEIRIVEFQDYIQPDAALDSGELDANSYQHLLQAGLVPTRVVSEKFAGSMVPAF